MGFFLLMIATDNCQKLSLDSLRFLQSSSLKDRLTHNGMVFVICDFSTRNVSMCCFSFGFIYFAASADITVQCKEWISDHFATDLYFP